jgi:hypothetical protein
MKSVKKKSKIQMAREIIANLRQGMAMRREAEPAQDNAVAPMPEPPLPRVRFQHARAMQTNRAW